MDRASESESKTPPGRLVAWFNPEWTDAALLTVLGAWPLIAALRAWTSADDLIIVMYVVVAAGVLARGNMGEEIRVWLASFANPFGVTLAIAILYAVASFFWSMPAEQPLGPVLHEAFLNFFRQTFEYSIDHLIRVIVLFVAASAIAARLKLIPYPPFHLWIAGATAAGLLVAGIDDLTGYKMLRAVYGPFLERHVNPNAVALSLLLWPALAALAAAGRLAFAIVLWGLAGFVMFQTPSEAAQGGFLLGSLVLLFAWVLPRAALAVSTAAAVAGVALAPVLYWFAGFAVALMPASVARDASALVRVRIWTAHADAVFNAPLFGNGVFFPGKSHPHSFPLQIWVEFGAVGAALAIAMILMGAVAVSRIEWRYRAFVLACAVAIYFHAYISYGLWEIQFLSIFLLVCLVMVHGAHSVVWRARARGVND